MKLTGTNRSIELDRSHCPCSSPRRRPKVFVRRAKASAFVWPGEGISLRPSDDMVCPHAVAAKAASLRATRSARARPHRLERKAHSILQRRVQTSENNGHRSAQRPSRPPILRYPNPASRSFALSRPGGSGGVAAPVPIPNTAVKRPSAYGTSS